MSSAKWKFTLAYTDKVSGDVVEALRTSGFGILESESIAEALMDTTELGISVQKQSAIDPKALVHNLKQAGLSVKWCNEPAA